MASAQQEKLLKLMATESGSISPTELAKKAELTQEAVSSQLTRMAKDDLATKDSEGKWLITELGKEAVTTLSQVEAGATDYDQFMAIGKQIGVEAGIIKTVVDHVWNGGDYKDPSWVKRALHEMRIRQDLLPRWYNSWCSYLGKSPPPEDGEELGPEGVARGAGEKSVPGKRDYIIAEEDARYVGEGLGDYTLKDAKDILGMRALRSRVPSQSGAPAQALTMHDILEIVDRLQGGKGAGDGSKSYVVSSTSEGTKVEEIEQGKPLVVPDGKSQPASAWFIDQEGNKHELQPNEPIVIEKPVPGDRKTWLVDPTTGSVRALEEGEPVVLRPPAPPPAPAKVYLVDSTGEVKTLESGEPIVVKPAATQSPGPTLVQVKDEKGNVVAVDLNASIEWGKYQREEARKDQMHDQVHGVLGAVREHIGKVAKGIDRLMKTQSPQETQALEESALIEVACAQCKKPVKIPRGTDQFFCKECQLINEVEA